MSNSPRENLDVLSSFNNWIAIQNPSNKTPLPPPRPIAPAATATCSTTRPSERPRWIRDSMCWTYCTPALDDPCRRAARFSATLWATKSLRPRHLYGKCRSHSHIARGPAPERHNRHNRQDALGSRVPVRGQHISHLPLAGTLHPCYDPPHNGIISLSPRLGP